jgi:Uma2 family endonuclease
MTTTLSSTYTAEDLLTMPDGDLYELVDGQLVEREMGTESSWIAGRLLLLLSAYVQDQQLGWVFPSDNSYQCFPNRPNKVRKPDVSFIRMGRLPKEELPRGHCRIAPDLVAEVISPNDLYSDVIRKVLEFLAVGVPLIWVVDPDTRTVTVYRANNTLTLLHEHEQLSGEKVLEGFTCQIAELFPPRPATSNPESNESQPE